MRWCTAAAARRRGRCRRPRGRPVGCGTGRARRRAAVATTDSRGNASSVGRHPPQRVRAAGAAVVAGPVRGDQPQLADRGLQRVGAHDRVDPLRQRDHVPDPPAPLAGGEVAADPAAQVAAGADVEDLVAGAAEQVHAGRGRHGLARWRLRRWWVVGGAARRRGRAPAAPPGSARPRLPMRSSRWCSTSTVARASARARCVGRVAAPNSSARAPSRTLGASSRVSTARASRAVQRTGGRGHARRGVRTRRAGTRRRTVRCAPRAPPRRGTPGRTAAPAGAVARR